MDDVEVLVTVWDRGQTRLTIVTVPASAFATRCWRTIAALAAAVYLELPFAEIEGKCKFGLRPADRDRLAELCRRRDDAETDSSLPSE